MEMSLNCNVYPQRNFKRLEPAFCKIITNYVPLSSTSGQVAAEKSLLLAICAKINILTVQQAWPHEETERTFKDKSKIPQITYYSEHLSTTHNDMSKIT